MKTRNAVIVLYILIISIHNLEQYPVDVCLVICLLITIEGGPRFIVVSLEDLLELAPPDADVPAVKEWEAHGVVEKSWEGLIFCVRRSVFVSRLFLPIHPLRVVSDSQIRMSSEDSHPNGLHRILHTPDCIIRGEDLRLQTLLQPCLEIPRPVLQPMQRLPRQEPRRIRAHLDIDQQIRHTLALQ